MFDPIENPAKRRNRIENACSGIVASHWISLRHGPTQLPTVHLDQDLLVYRVDNGRLLASLQEEFSQRPAELTRLHQQEDKAETQELLHRLLLKKAADERGPILRELRRLKVQTEPLLVDATGVVINGNRRLSAMRQLLDEDPQAYTRFKRPLVAVLPASVSRTEVEYIETALQLAPETKLPYGWVDRRLKLRQQIDVLGLDPDWVKEAYRLDSRETLEQELSQLSLVETYLNDLCKAPNQYSIVAACEQLFQKLQQQLEELSSDLREPWQAIGLLLIQQRRHLAPTFDRQFPFEAAINNAMPTLILQRLVEEGQFQLGLQSQPSRLKRRHRRRIVGEVLQNQEPKRLARAVESAVEETRQQLRQERVPSRVLHHLQVSKRLLEKLTPETLNSSERFEMKAEAEAIQGRLRLLLADNQSSTATSMAQGLWRLQRRLRRILFKPED
ncbi:hypothetical protein [Synechococcus sp. CC9616]|uniref:hypothetical protein n=1 Tax=Synechococcus sp. CC9616 TaxID=110663 RepID=UPI00048E219E|nr:hypothetical protein [Synechococcus sp. CC9616]